MAKEKHRVSNAELELQELESLASDLIDQECAVIVTGIDKKCTQDNIIMYFENKRSGGGDVEDVYFADDEDSAVITFSSPGGI